MQLNRYKLSFHCDLFNWIDSNFQFFKHVVFVILQLSLHVRELQPVSAFVIHLNQVTYQMELRFSLNYGINQSRNEYYQHPIFAKSHQISSLHTTNMSFISKHATNFTSNPSTSTNPRHNIN